MSRPIQGRNRRAVAAAAVTALVCSGAASLAAGGSAAAAEPAAPGARITEGDVPVPAGSGGDDATAKARALGVPREGRFTFLLELDEPSTATATNRARASGLGARSAGRAQLQRVREAQSEVVAALPAQSPVLYRLHSAMSAVAVTTDVDNVAALGEIDGVKAVYPVAPKKTDNAYAVPLQGAPSVWQATSNYGAGVKVGIVDTGIDYTHANFGGVGTPEAWEAANATEAQAADPAYFGPDAVKVKGGYDFVGDAYNADPTSPDYDPVPAPDDNPLDCNGHGSHVAGSAAGLGENADGSTYTGSYGTVTPFSTMKIGPGMAPEADLYALRVFGCEGSTNVTAEAIDWSMDPNGDGDTSDHLDVVNMSLGSDYGNPVDGDTVAVDRASKAGVLFAISAGNSSDLYDIGGSPGSATRALTSAASVDAANVVDALDVTLGDTDQSYGASRSIAYDWATKPDLAGQVVQVSTTDTGCAAYSTADAAKIAGKVVVVKWTQEALECGSVARGTNLANAGAVGFIFANSAETFSAGITGVASIPGVLVAKSGGDAIRAALAAGETVTADGTRVNAITQTVPGDDDKVTDFTSRGTRGAGGLKPDVAAVGATVFSAAVGTGNEGVTESGTSMASPMTAGLAALVRKANPTWNVEQVKANIMNTAGQDLFTEGSAGKGTRYAPNRVGAGRIQAVPALANKVVAYVQDDPGAVSVSFGPVEVTGPTTLTKTVKVDNLGTAAATYATSYDAITTVPGASYTVSPASISVPAGASRTVQVTFRVADAKALTKTVDATHGRVDVTGATLETLADASGNLLLTPSGSAPQLRVPVYSAPRPAASMSQAAAIATPAPSSTLTLTGTGVDQGTGVERVQSVVAGLELQHTSGPEPRCLVAGQEFCVVDGNDRAADIEHVGTASDDVNVAARDRMSYFGIAAHGPSSAPAGKAEFDIYVDANRDGRVDAIGYNTTVPDKDVFIVNWVSPAGALLDQTYLDNRTGARDLAVFDSEVALYPIRHALLRSLGMATTGANAGRVDYGVVSFGTSTGQLVDGAGSLVGADLEDLSFNALAPGLQVTDAAGIGPYAVDAPGTQLTLTRNEATYAADGGLGVLLVHFHNKTGDKAQVVTLAEGSTTTLSATPTTVAPGTPVAMSVSVAGSDGTVPQNGTPVEIVDTATGAVLATQGLTAGSTVISYTPTTPGTYSLVARFAGDSALAPSQSSPVVLTVTGATTPPGTTPPGTTPPGTPAGTIPALQAKLTFKRGQAGSKTKLKVDLRQEAGKPVPTGKVKLTVNGKKVKVKSVRNGKVTFAVRPGQRGTYKMRVVYRGDATYALVRSEVLRYTAT